VSSGGEPAVKVGVKVPVMPRGVEHFTDPYSLANYDQVKVPVMPRGVEH